MTRSPRRFARGAAASLLLASTVLVATACGDSGTFNTQGCLPKEADNTCLAAADAQKRLPILEDCSGIDSVTDGPTITQDPSPCCYRYTLKGCRTN